ARQPLSCPYTTLFRSKQDVLRKIAEVGLVPVVRAQSADEAMKVVDAIREGGVPVLEITMTVPGALGVMEQVARRFGSDVVLGARSEEHTSELQSRVDL